jgi:translation initiation factor 2 alpha subunit (eIF-2alpha)
MNAHYFYPRTVPENDEIVMAEVATISDVAVYCHLPAYGGLEAMLPTSEINVRRHRKVADYVRVGQLVPVQVLRVDMGRVDVSMKQVREHEATEATGRHHRDAKVNLIVRTAAGKDAAAVETLYREHVWPLEDAYATFEEVRAAGASDSLPPALVTAILAKMPEATYTKEQDVLLRFGMFHDGVRRLEAALTAIAETEGIQVFVVAPPTYRVRATDKTPGRAAERLAAVIATLPKPC